MIGHIDHGQSFDIQGLDVLFKHDFITRMKFFFIEDFVRNKQLNSFFCYQLLQCLRSVGNIRQSAFFGFLDPLVGVVVAVEYNALMFLGGFLQQFLKISVKVFRFFQVCRQNPSGPRL